MRGRAAGLTLIEILVALSIVMLLAALGLRGLAGAREAARRTGCQANLTQWRVGLTTYMDTYKGYLPFAVEAVNYVDDFKDPVNVLANHLGIPEPRINPDGTVEAAVPWRCPSDPYVAQRCGTSYLYELRLLMDWLDTSRMDRIKSWVQSGRELPVFVRDAMAFHHPKPDAQNVLRLGGRNVLKSDWSIQYVEP